MVIVGESRPQVEMVEKAFDERRHRLANAKRSIPPLIG